MILFVFLIIDSILFSISPSTQLTLDEKLSVIDEPIDCLDLSFFVGEDFLQKRKTQIDDLFGSKLTLDETYDDYFILETLEKEVLDYLLHPSQEKCRLLIFKIVKMKWNGHQASFDLLNSFLDLLKKDIVLSEDNYKALYLLYTPRHMLEEQIKLFRQSSLAVFVEDCWNQKSSLPFFQRDVVNDPLSNLILHMDVPQESFFAKYHLMEVAFYQEEDMYKIVDLLRSQNWFVLEEVKNLETLAILASLKGLLTTAEREFLIAFDQMHHQLTGEKTILACEPYQEGLEGESRTPFFMSRQMKDVSVECVSLISDQGMDYLVWILKENILEHRIKWSPIDHVSLYEKEFFENKMNLFLEKVSLLPEHLRFFMHVYGPHVSESPMKTNSSFYHFVDSFEGGHISDCFTCFPPHLLELLHECLTDGLTLHVRHSYGYTSDAQKFVSLYTSKQARPLMIPSFHFFKNTSKVHNKVNLFFHQYVHDVFHIDKFFFLHKERYLRHCLQELLVPFILENRQFFTENYDKKIYQLKRGFSLDLLIGVLAEGIPDEMNLMDYIKICWIQDEKGYKFSIPLLLNSIFVEEMKQKFIDKINNSYGEILSDDRNKGWQKEEFWWKLEEFLASKQQEISVCSYLNSPDLLSFQPSLRTDVLSVLMHLSAQGDMNQIPNFWAQLTMSQQHRYGRRICMEALLRGHLNVVDFFCKQKVSLCGKDSNGQSVFVRAVYENQIQVIHSLVHLSAGAESEDAYGISPLSLALQRDDLPLFKLLLLDSSVSSKYKAFYFIDFLSAGHFEMGLYFLGLGVNINIFSQSRTLLYWAIERGDEVLTTFLLEHGACTQGINNYVGLNNALEMTLKKEDYRTSQEIFEKGCDINQEVLSKTLCSFSCSDQYFQQVVFLVQRGANIYFEREFLYKDCPLKIAINKGACQIVAYFLQNGASFEDKFFFDRSVLEYLFFEGSFDMIQFFSSSIDCQKYHKVLKECFFYFCRRIRHSYQTDLEACLKKINFILDKGISIDIQDEKGCTALMIAVQNRSIQLIELLLDRQANVEIQNNQKQRVFDIMNSISDSDEVCDIFAKRYQKGLLKLPEKLSKLHSFTSHRSKRVVGVRKNKIKDFFGEIIQKSKSSLGKKSDTSDLLRPVKKFRSNEDTDKKDERCQQLLSQPDFFQSDVSESQNCQKDSSPCFLLPGPDEELYVLEILLDTYLVSSSVAQKLRELDIKYLDFFEIIQQKYLMFKRECFIKKSVLLCTFKNKMNRIIYEELQNFISHCFLSSDCTSQILKDLMKIHIQNYQSKFDDIIYERRLRDKLSEVVDKNIETFFVHKPIQYLNLDFYSQLDVMTFV